MSFLYHSTAKQYVHSYWGVFNKFLLVFPKIDSISPIVISISRGLALVWRTESVWGKNKKLEEFWRKLASGKEVVLVYENDKKQIYTMPKTHTAKSNKYKELENDNNIKAIITSAQSSDVYEALYKKVKNKTPQGILKNYRKYLINYGNGDKSWYL